MASPSTVLTRGLGAWGSVNLLVTRGLGIGEQAEVIPGPFRSLKGQAYSPGSKSAQPYSPGAIASQSHSPGAQTGESI